MSASEIRGKPSRPSHDRASTEARGHLPRRDEEGAGQRAAPVEGSAALASHTGRDALLSIVATSPDTASRCVSVEHGVSNHGSESCWARSHHTFLSLRAAPLIPEHDGHVDAAHNDGRRAQANSARTGVLCVERPERTRADMCATSRGPDRHSGATLCCCHERGSAVMRSWWSVVGPKSAESGLSMVRYRSASSVHR